MNILESINVLINEGYLFSDKTISIDLDKFESGESSKLFVNGLSGGGKTTLGIHLAKKYKCKYLDTDDIGKEMVELGLTDKVERRKYYNRRFFKVLDSNIRYVIGGVGITRLHRDNPEKKELLMTSPMIFLGKSMLRSTWDASARINSGPETKDKNRLTKASVFFGWNWNNFYPRLVQMKKDRIKAGGNIQEFKVPRL